jgi:hypothetical protein
MARIELRDCTIRIKDGLSGTALITEGAVASAVLLSGAVNSDLTFTALDEGIEWNSWNFTTVADVNAGANADATLPINAANGDLVFTSPTKDDLYNGCIFEADSNGAEAVLYDVNTDTFTLEFNTAVSTGTSMKTAFDTALGLNPTWPQWACAVEGDGGGVWLVADDDAANIAAANGVDVVAAAVTFSPNTFTIHTTGANIASDIVTMWGVGPAQCANWSIADEGAGGGLVDATTIASAGGLAEPANTDTDVNISTVVLNTTVTNKVPVGARFTPSTAGHTTVHTVTARTPAGAGPTTNVVFTPAWGLTNIPEKGDTLNFLPQQIDIKVGEGNLTYTEAKEYEYLLDRGVLDSVKEGDEQPLEASLEFVYEHVTTGTAELITPVDALKNKNGASEWVSSSSDLCEPYAVDVEIDHEAPCGSVQDETTLLPEFRYDSLEFNLQDATIAVAGKCNATEATITRS